MPSASPRFASTRKPSARPILGKLIYEVGKDPQHATRHDWFLALALAVRDRLVDGWMDTTRDGLRRRPQAGLLLSAWSS